MNRRQELSFLVTQSSTNKQTNTRFSITVHSHLTVAESDPLGNRHSVALFFKQERKHLKTMEAYIDYKKCLSGKN